MNLCKWPCSANYSFSMDTVKKYWNHGFKNHHRPFTEQDTDYVQIR